MANSQTTQYYRYCTTWNTQMAFVYGLSDLAIIDPGATILRRFISDELDVFDSIERTPLLQDTSLHARDRGQYVQNRRRAARDVLASSLVLLLVFVLLFTCYVVVSTYFWIGGMYVLLEDVTRNRICDRDLHVWLGIALFQPILNGWCFPRAFDPGCSKILGWILSMGLILTGASCFTQSYASCATGSPSFYNFVQAYLVYMTITWILLLVLPLLPWVLLSTGANLLPQRQEAVDQVMLDSIESVPFDIKLFTEDASASEGLMPAECCVCCERFGREKVIKRTPCNHVFHEDCLARWLKVTDSCPVCRKSMRKVEDPEWGPSEECAPTSPTSPASDGESFENT